MRPACYIPSVHVPVRGVLIALIHTSVYVLLAATLVAQDCYPAQASFLKGVQVIYHLQEFDDPSCTKEVQEVRTLFRRPDTAWRYVDRELYDGDYGTCHWFRVCVDFQLHDTIYLEPGIHSFSELYLYKAGVLEAAFKMGNGLPLAQRTSQLVWPMTYRNTARLVVAPQRYEIIYRTQNPNGPNLFSTYAGKRLAIRSAARLEQQAGKHQVITAFVIGWMVLLSIFLLTSYAMSGDRILKWFFAFVVCQALYICYEDFVFVALLPGVAFDDVLLILAVTLAPYSFFRFMRVLLEEIDPRPRVTAMLSVFAYEKLSAGVLWLSLLVARMGGVSVAVWGLGYMGLWFRITFLVEVLLLIPVFVSLYRRRDDAAVKALTSGLFAMTVCIFMYVSQVFLDPIMDWSIVESYMALLRPVLHYLTEIGTLLMSLGFALAVVLVVQRRERERERAFGEELLQVEMSALRSQMNPHFLFNGLNSIKLFIIRSDVRAASDYLTKFSRLIRLILENSKQAMVPLSVDLRALKIYVELESLRFAERFEYDFTIGAEVDAEYVLLPPMLIQPYVENAIWHGLLHKSEGTGKLSVTIRALNTQSLQIIIRDNGVGRAAAQEAKSRSATVQKSLGMHISQERLEKLAAAHDFAASVKVRDLTSQGRAAGTEVVISLTYLTGPPTTSGSRSLHQSSPIVST